MPPGICPSYPRLALLGRTSDQAIAGYGRAPCISRCASKPSCRCDRSWNWPPDTADSLISALSRRYLKTFPFHCCWAAHQLRTHTLRKPTNRFTERD